MPTSEHEVFVRCHVQGILAAIRQDETTRLYLDGKVIVTGNDPQHAWYLAADVLKKALEITQPKK